jgi:hypothetical protein
MGDNEAPKKSEKRSFWTTLPGILTGCASVMTALATLMGACYTVGRFIGGENGLFLPASILAPPTDTPQPAPTATSTPVPLSTPDSSSASSLSVPPANSGCPYDARAGWLQYWNTWYGPWDGFYIRYDQYFFYVYDPNQWNATAGVYGLETPYSTQFNRNAWTELVGSPFWVCVDMAGNVYGVYVP